MSIMKFAGHEHAAVKVVVRDSGKRELVSYSTTVAEISPDGWLKVNGLYSRTTIKHLGWFARSIGFTYYDLKALYERGEEMNVNTGEIRKASAA